MNKQRKMLRERLLRSEILVLPGVYDALTAKIAAEVGFDALVMGGYSIAASRLCSTAVQVSIHPEGQLI